MFALNPAAAAVTGTKLGIGTSALYAVLGYGVVFIGLVLLMIVIIIVGKIMVASQKKAAAPKAAPTAEPAAPAAPAAVKEELAPGSAGGVKIYDVSERDAAIIMAIVADKLGKPLNEIRFKSIKEVK